MRVPNKLLVRNPYVLSTPTSYNPSPGGGDGSVVPNTGSNVTYMPVRSLFEEQAIIENAFPAFIGSELNVEMTSYSGYTSGPLARVNYTIFSNMVGHGTTQVKITPIASTLLVGEGAYRTITITDPVYRNYVEVFEHTGPLGAEYLGFKVSLRCADFPPEGVCFVELHSAMLGTDALFGPVGVTTFDYDINESNYGSLLYLGGNY